MDSFSQRKKGIVALIVLSFVFACMGLFARYLATGFFVFQQVYLRMFAAFVIGFVVLRKQLNLGKIRKISGKDWGIIIFRAISFAVFGVTLFTQAIVLTKYSNVSFISALPVTAVLGFFLLKEKFSLGKILLVALAFFGVVLIAVKDYAHLFVWGYGEILTLTSTVFFSLGYVARKWQSKFLNNSELTVLNFFVAFLAVLFVSLVKADGLPVSGWTPGLLIAIIGAGTFNVANVFLINYGFEKVDAVLASNILTLESFFAILLGYLFYGETPLVKELIGGAIIIASVIWMNQLEKKDE